MHRQPFYPFDSDARMTLQSRHFMDGNVVDEVRLARLQCSEACPILGDFANNNLFDRRSAAPIIVVAGENQIAAALKADIFTDRYRLSSDTIDRHTYLPAALLTMKRFLNRSKKIASGCLATKITV